MKLLYIGALWCPSCIIMRPRYQGLIKSNSSIEWIEKDYDQDALELSSLSVGTKLPVCILFDKQGAELLRIVGEKRIVELQQLFGAHL